MLRISQTQLSQILLEVTPFKNKDEMASTEEDTTPEYSTDYVLTAS